MEDHSFENGLSSRWLNPTEKQGPMNGEESLQRAISYYQLLIILEISRSTKMSVWTD